MKDLLKRIFAPWSPWEDVSLYSVQYDEGYASDEPYCEVSIRQRRRHLYNNSIKFKITFVGNYRPDKVPTLESLTGLKTK